MVTVACTVATEDSLIPASLPRLYHLGCHRHVCAAGSLEEAHDLRQHFFLYSWYSSGFFFCRVRSGQNITQNTARRM
jgi:hypothetical protein